MKRVLITAGAQGIGRACVKQLLGEGYHVLVADNDAEAGQDLLEHYQTLGQLEFFSTDVSCEVQLKELTDRLKTCDRLDALINNRPLAKVQLDNDGYRPRDCSVDTFARSLMQGSEFPNPSES